MDSIEKINTKLKIAVFILSLAAYYFYAEYPQISLSAGIGALAALVYLIRINKKTVDKGHN